MLKYRKRINITGKTKGRMINDIAATETASMNQALHQEARNAPYDVSYTVRMRINQMEDLVKVQPTHRCHVAVLQALRISNTPTGLNCELVEKDNALCALLEILLYQGLT